MKRERVALTSVRTFEAVARHLSVRAAAAELFVTPGAVSQQVVQLEKWLGASLFVRSGRRLALTPEGHMLAVKIGVALDQIDDAIRRAKKRDYPPCSDWPRSPGQTTVYRLIENILQARAERST